VWYTSDYTYADILFSYQYDGFGNLVNPFDPTGGAGQNNNNNNNSNNNTNNSNNNNQTCQAYEDWHDRLEDNTNPFRFSGEYYDWSTGTYYLRARYFNPRTGRFTQADPFWNAGNMQSSNYAILQAGNLFAYTINNPIRWIDPSGIVIELWGDSSYRLGLFQLLERLTRDHLSFTIHSSGSGVFWNITLTEIDGYSRDAGTRLIRKLVSSHHTTQIRTTDGHSRAFTSNGIGATTPGIGASSRVYLNMNDDHLVVVQGPSGNAFKATPLKIVLGHELIHALHIAEGVFIPDDQVADISFHLPGYGNFTIPNPIEEIRTIGITVWMPITDGSWHGWNSLVILPSITENDLRRDHELPRRTVH